MKDDSKFQDGVRRIRGRDPRFHPRAYAFVAEGVTHTARRIREREGRRRHISGRELLEGLRELVLLQFGPLSFEVLREWGVSRTECFGTIVFHLVEEGLLGASEEDSPEDFAGGYDFREAFVKPFEEPGDIPKDHPQIV